MNYKAKPRSKDLRTDFAHYNLFIESDAGTGTNFGVFPIESIVGQQLNPVEFHIKFLVTIDKSNARDFFCLRTHNLTIKIN